MFNMTAMVLKSAGSVYSTYKTFISNTGFSEINQENLVHWKHIIY